MISKGNATSVELEKNKAPPVLEIDQLYFASEIQKLGDAKSKNKRSIATKIAYYYNELSQENKDLLEANIGQKFEKEFAKIIISFGPNLVRDHFLDRIANDYLSNLNRSNLTRPIKKLAPEILTPLPYEESVASSVQPLQTRGLRYPQPLTRAGRNILESSSPPLSSEGSSQESDRSLNSGNSTTPSSVNDTDAIEANLRILYHGGQLKTKVELDALNNIASIYKSLDEGTKEDFQKNMKSNSLLRREFAKKFYKYNPDIFKDTKETSISLCILPGLRGFGQLRAISDATVHLDMSVDEKDMVARSAISNLLRSARDRSRENEKRKDFAYRVIAKTAYGLKPIYQDKLDELIARDNRLGEAIAKSRAAQGEINPDENLYRVLLAKQMNKYTFPDGSAKSDKDSSERQPKREPDKRSVVTFNGRGDAPSPSSPRASLQQWTARASRGVRDAS